MDPLPTAAQADTPAPDDTLDSGVDVTLLIANLRLTPTQRVQRAQQMRDAVLALQREALRWRERQAQTDLLILPELEELLRLRKRPQS